MSQKKPEQDAPNGEPAPATPVIDVERKTPSEWSKTVPAKLAHIFAAASQLYGWEEHAFHFQAKPQLFTKEEFDAALKAAGEFPASELPLSAFGARALERFKPKAEARAKAKADREAAEKKAAEAAKKAAEQAAGKGA